MAKYELPAMVNFILKKTEQSSLYYAGHSQGSLMAFAEFSRNQPLAKKIKAVFALGPVAYLGNMESPLKYLVDYLPELEVYFEIHMFTKSPSNVLLIKEAVSRLNGLNFSVLLLVICVNLLHP